MRKKLIMCFFLEKKRLIGSGELLKYATIYQRKNSVIERQEYQFKEIIEQVLQYWESLNY